MRFNHTPAALIPALMLCAAGPAGPAGAQQADWAGLVDIGGGRQMFLECRGAGSPTVVLIAGGFEAGWIWSYALTPGDPVHDAPGDAFSAGLGNPQKLGTAVFPTVAGFTRVCLYDRPNTTLGDDVAGERGGQVSTPVAQPHRLEDDVADLHALLAAAGEPGPYVLAAHSYGGMIAELFARRYPAEVAGEVLVDVTSAYLRETLTPGEFAELVASVRTPPPGGEALDLGDAVETILAAPPGPQVPAVLFTSDKLDVAAAPARRAELLAAHERLAAQLGARHVTDTASGHHIHVERPQLVSDAIRDVVTQASTARQVQELIPDLESYIANNMKDFDVPGLAIGIVSGDRLVYAKGFGIRSGDGDPVDTETVFQIGSITKQFLAGMLAIAVDAGKLNWDDRVVDLDTDFQLHDPWVTREFRVFDLLAQRSGLPPYVNDSLALLGLDRSALVRSLRHVDPVSSFRSGFAYTNITHILASRILARVHEAADWSVVLQAGILDPLGMKDTSIGLGAIVAAADHAEGFRFTPDGSIMVPFNEFMPYGFDGAGAMNSNIADMSKWVSLQLAGGTTPEGRRIISSESLAYTHMPKVAMSDRVSYALGWSSKQTPNGDLLWHNGETLGFGAMIVLQLDRKLGIIVLSNQTNVRMPDAIGFWAMDRLLGNPMTDHGTIALPRARTAFADSVARFARPANPEPSPGLAPLAGNFAHPGVGKAVLRMEGESAVLALMASGARLRLDPWNGAVYTATLVPDGEFAAIAAGLGPLPMGFGQFQNDQDGRPTTFRLTFADGQAYDFRRE